MSTSLIHLTDIDIAQIQAANSSYWVNLSYLALIHISGDDAENFLQGQFTNDILQLQPGSSQLSAYCTPKGRVVATLWICRSNSDFWLIIPKDNVEYFIKRLKMYVMRSKVTITLSKDHQLMGRVGIDTSLHLPGVEGLYSLTFSPWSAVSAQWVVVEKTSFSQNKIQKPLYHFDLWKYMQIISGIPQVYTTTCEQFIPQHINLDLIEGVSFKKGCYPGQEIIARLEYLGKTKQRLFVLHVQTEINIVAADKIHSEAIDQKQIGTIVDAVKLDTKTVMATAVLNIAANKDTPLLLSAHPQAIIEIDTPPYSIS